MRAALAATGATSRTVKLGMTVPQMLVVSAYRQVTDRLALMASFDWQQWAAFGKQDIGIESERERAPNRTRPFSAPRGKYLTQPPELDY